MPTTTSTATRTGRHQPPTEATQQPVNDPGCDVCPHPIAHHDAIGLRFCRATLDSAIARGCVCRAE
jgi:hypothetical protein